MTISTSIVSLQRVIDIALAKGFTQEQAQVAAAVASSEGTPPQGKPVIQGDFNASGVPTSFGPFQFHIGGQLNNFAVWLHSVLGHPADLGTAADIANSNQELAVSYALDNYLGAAIRKGSELGLHGADLANYVSAHGQVSAFPQNAAKAYTNLFGTAGSSVISNPGTTTDTTIPALSSDIAHEIAGQVGITLPAGSTDSGLGFNLGPFKLPTGLIALFVGLVLLIVGGLLTYTTIEKPNVSVKLPSKSIG